MQKTKYRFLDAGVKVSCHNLKDSDLSEVRRILENLGLKIVSIDIKPSGNA